MFFELVKVKKREEDPYIYVSRAPRTSSLASTVAPASSSASTVSVCPFMADCLRAVRSCCRIGGVRGEWCRGGQGAHAYMHTHGCVPGCVCVNQYMHLHAHIPPHVQVVIFSSLFLFLLCKHCITEKKNKKKSGEVKDSVIFPLFFYFIRELNPHHPL